MSQAKKRIPNHYLEKEEAMQQKSKPKHRSCRISKFKFGGKCIERVKRLWCRMLKFWRGERRPIAVTLGQYVKGVQGPWVRADGKVVLPEAQLRRHVVMLGTGPRAHNPH